MERIAGKGKSLMETLGIKSLHSLSIEHPSKIEIVIYDKGCNCKDLVKKAIRSGDSVTISGRTIWRENHSVGQGPNHDFIWDETGDRILVEEVLKVRNDTTNELKIIIGRRKYVNYDRWAKE